MGNLIRSDDNKCPICGEEGIEIDALRGELSNYNYYNCWKCGEYFTSDRWYYKSFSRLEVDSEHSYDEEKLKSYLFYHKGEMRPFLVSEKVYMQFDREQFSHIYNLTPQMVEAWYPKNFAEKIDKILLKIAEISKYDGAYVSIEKRIEDLFFCKEGRAYGVREGADKRVQVDYVFNFLEKNGYIEDLGSYTVQLTPKALERVYELQKSRTNNTNVFIAMKFGEETIALREALKQAVSDIGYKPILIDEVQYNGQIVPEMLYQIRESRFVIAELSHHNNGAYYEAGYALGFGKEVIHICEEEAMSSKLHFDVKQVNTITYKADDLKGLKDRLIKRIQATIK